MDIAARGLFGKGNAPGPGAAVLIGIAGPGAAFRTCRRRAVRIRNDGPAPLMPVQDCTGRDRGAAVRLDEKQDEHTDHGVILARAYEGSVEARRIRSYCEAVRPGLIQLRTRGILYPWDKLMSASETKAGGLSGRLRSVVESARFRHAITALILINAVILGIETYALPETALRWLRIADTIIVGLFVAELVLKLAAWRLSFFRSGWNWFDLFVVGISLMPSAGAFTVLRALRVLRLFRLFSVIPEMRKVVEALGKAIPGMGAIMLVLGLIFYVSAVMGAKLFGGTHPQFFEDVGASAFTLFQVMTLESWSMGVARPVIEAHPYAWIFFVLFIVTTSFAVLNLFIAVIVDSLQSKHFDEETAREDAAHNERERLLEDVAALRRDIADLKASLTEAQRPPAASSNLSDKSE